MTATNLSICATFTFGQEGDETVSLDEHDPGCWSSGIVGVGELLGTRYGVSAPEAIKWLAPAVVTAQTMAEFPRDTATAIFGQNYFQAMRCGDMAAGIDLSVCDHGFNAGATTSVKLLQRILGFQGPDLDGWSGPQTIAALQSFNPFSYLRKLSAQSLMAAQAHVGVTADGKLGPVTIGAVQAWPERTFLTCCLLADAQLADYEGDAGWARYGHGWSNRVSARLQAALALIPKPAPDDASMAQEVAA